MSSSRPLQGACSCGRNHYVITLPEDASERALVYFDDSSESRRSQATPLTAWLRVPLTWYSSATTSYFPDETHNSIRKIFTPLHTPQCQRVFCGYCGTHLSYWTEHPAEEAEYMNVTLGSLLSDHLQALQDLDLLPDDVQLARASAVAPTAMSEDPAHSSTLESPSQQQENQPLTRTARSGRTGNLTWFEEMLDGSHLGRIQNTRHGVGMSNDGSTKVEWEVSEYSNDGTEQNQTPATSKRKIGEVAKDDDVHMQQ